MSYSIVLFVHVLAALILASSMNIEILGLSRIRRANAVSETQTWVDLAPRLAAMGGICALVLLLSGGFLTSEMTGWGLDKAGPQHLSFDYRDFCCRWRADRASRQSPSGALADDDCAGIHQHSRLSWTRYLNPGDSCWSFAETMTPECNVDCCLVGAEARLPCSEVIVVSAAKQ